MQEEEQWEERERKKRKSS